MDACPGEKQMNGKMGRLAVVWPFSRYTLGKPLRLPGNARLPSGCFEAASTPCRSDPPHHHRLWWLWLRRVGIEEPALRNIRLVFACLFDEGLWRTEQKCEARRFSLLARDTRVSRGKHLPPGGVLTSDFCAPLNRGWHATGPASCLRERGTRDRTLPVALSLLSLLLSCRLEKQKTDIFY